MKQFIFLILLSVGISLSFALDTWAGGRFGVQSFSRGSSGFKGSFRANGFGVNRGFKGNFRGNRSSINRGFKGSFRGNRSGVNRSFKFNTRRGSSRFRGRTQRGNRFITSRQTGSTVLSRQRVTGQNHLSRLFPNERGRNMGLNRTRSGLKRRGVSRPIFRRGNTFSTTRRSGSVVVSQPFGFVSQVPPVIIGPVVINGTQTSGFSAFSLQRRSDLRFIDPNRTGKKKSHHRLRRMKNGKQVFSDFGGRIIRNR